MTMVYNTGARYSQTPPRPASNPEVDEMIVRLAKQKADSLGIPLLSTWRSSGKSKQARVIVEFDRTESELAVNMLPREYLPQPSIFRRVSRMTTGIIEKILLF